MDLPKIELEEVERLRTVDMMVEIGFSRNTAEQALNKSHEICELVHERLHALKTAPGALEDDIALIAAALFVGTMFEWSSAQQGWAKMVMRLCRHMDQIENAGPKRNV